MQKIDPHHHLWDLSSQMYSWLTAPVENNFLGNYQNIKKNYLLADYLRDCANQQIVKSVHIQAGYNRAHSVDETKWLQGMADQHGFPHGIVAYANLASTNVEEILKAHCQYPNMRGIRQCLNWHTDPYYKDCEENFIDQIQWQKGYALLEKYNLSFDMQIYPDQMMSALALAKQYPHINIIIDHVGLPLWQDKINIWQERLAELAAFRNIFIKLSGFGMIKHNWTMTEIEPYIKYIIEIFGADRCMFASNFPVDGLYASLDKLYGAYETIVSEYNIREQENLFYNNARSIYRL